MLKLTKYLSNIAKPRKPRSPYTCWSMEKMPEVKRQNPNITNPQKLHQILGMLWREEDVLIKEKYQKIYEQRMKVYDRALKNYKNNEPEEPKKKVGRPPKNKVDSPYLEKQKSRDWKMKIS